MAINSRITTRRTPTDLLETLWSESTKNQVARAYLTGTIDCLCWAGLISDVEHEGFTAWIMLAR